MLIILISFSCKKEDACVLNSTTLVGNYRVASLSYKETFSNPIKNLMQYLKPCEEDNFISIKSNGDFIVNDGSDKCSPSQDMTYKWYLDGDTLFINNKPRVIQFFDCRTLIFIAKNVNVQGDELKYTLIRK